LDVDADGGALAIGLAVGAMVGHANITGAARAAILPDARVRARNLEVTARNTSQATANVVAASGGILAGTGAEAKAEFSPVIQAAINDADIDVTEDISVSSQFVPDAYAEAKGISGGVLTVGVSKAESIVSPEVTAYAGGANSTISGRTLSVTASQTVPAAGHTTGSKAYGASGGLISINATESRAENAGVVNGYVADNATLSISESIDVSAVGDSSQWAEGDSYFGAIIAAGGNVVDAVSNVETSAYLGSGVTIGAGDPVGGLTDGEVYYVMVDDTRPFAPSTDITGNKIDLGPHHGLQTGDEVIYRRGDSTNNPVGGLDNNKTYFVVVDGSEPDKIRLRVKNEDGTEGALVAIDKNAASGSGHHFDIVTPRQVKLATTFQNATDDTPVTVDLDDPAVPGSNHRLTPYQRSTEQGVSFDPSTALDASADTLNVGSDHGLYTGEAVIYTKGTGPSLSISATGKDTNFALSEAGSGGLVAGAGAEANVDADSTTRAYIADDADPDDSKKTTLEVSSLNITADHTARFDSQTDTIQASAVGFSGSWATNTVDATTEAFIGSHADVTTQNLVVDAVNTSRKDLVDELAGDGTLDHDYNVKAGSGGVLQGNAAESETDIANITHAVVHDSAVLTVNGDVSNPGEFRLSAFNDVEAYDDVKLDSGGVIVGSGATSAIRPIPTMPLSRSETASQSPRSEMWT